MIVEKKHRPERHVQQPRLNDVEYPEQIEEIFFREWQFMQNEIRIRSMIENEMIMTKFSFSQPIQSKF